MLIDAGEEHGCSKWRPCSVTMIPLGNIKVLPRAGAWPRFPRCGRTAMLTLGWCGRSAP